MHALFVTYTLRDADPAQHAELCEQLAPAVAAVPGLLAKTWLTNCETGRFGGFYVFATRADSSATSRASCSTRCCRPAWSAT
jgi:hypothetical protein